jgi:hypothetical protein
VLLVGYWEEKLVEKRVALTDFRLVGPWVEWTVAKMGSTLADQLVLRTVDLTVEYSADRSVDLMEVPWVASKELKWESNSVALREIRKAEQWV